MIISLPSSDTFAAYGAGPADGISMRNRVPPALSGTATDAWTDPFT